MKSLIKKRLNRISAIFAAIIMCAAAVFLYFDDTVAVYADSDTVSAYESQNVLDDLDGSTIAGVDFDLADYPYDENGKPQVLNFVEFAYSFYSDNQDDYGLYIYVYNPQGYAITDSDKNQIEFDYADSDNWDKYTLEMLNYSTKSGYEGLFYKFKVTLSDSRRSAILQAQSQSARVYEISGIELCIGSSSAVEYEVGGTYTYSGYALGYGSSVATESSLTCTVDGFEDYLTLDVHSTYYRPEGTNSEAYTRDTLHSVYFSVPNEMIEEYGDMTAVHATWLNAQTAPIFVTGNSSVYQAVYEYLGEYVYGGNYYQSSDKDSNTDLEYSLIASQYIESASYNNASYGFSYMSYNANETLTVSDVGLNYLYYCFLAEDNDADSYILPAEALLGNIADGTKGWFETFTESYGGTLVNGQYSSVLFDSIADEFTNISISADDEYKLTDETISQNIWQKIIGGGYTVSNSTEYTVSAIKKVESSDFQSTATATCEGLYIDESDYEEFLSYYNTAVKNDETVYLFRYYQSDYTHYEVAEYSRNDSADWTILQGYLFGYDYIDTNAYFCQMWVQLGFDIIDLTFTKDNVETVIAVVMSPLNIAADGGTTLLPSEDSDWDWTNIIGILLLILLLIICAPFLPGIVKFIVWVITLPFKLIGGIGKAIKKRDRTNENKKE